MIGRRGHRRSHSRSSNINSNPRSNTSSNTVRTGQLTRRNPGQGELTLRRRGIWRRTDRQQVLRNLLAGGTGRPMRALVRAICQQKSARGCSRISDASNN